MLQTPAMWIVMRVVKCAQGQPRTTVSTAILGTGGLAQASARLVLKAKANLLTLIFSPKAALQRDVCSVDCDTRASGCKTCSSDPKICLSCFEDWDSENGKCSRCPDHCFTCGDASSCSKCQLGYHLSKYGLSFTKCEVDKCSACEIDLGICTKCKEKYTLKSSTECEFIIPPPVVVKTPPPISSPMVGISTTNTPGLRLDILNDYTSLELRKAESKTASAIYVTDKLTMKK